MKLILIKLYKSYLIYICMFNSIISTKYINNSIWTDDNTVNSCHNCKNDFTFLNRRHHCRLCGKIFVIHVVIIILILI